MRKPDLFLKGERVNPGEEMTGKDTERNKNQENRDMARQIKRYREVERESKRNTEGEASL